MKNEEEFLSKMRKAGEVRSELIRKIAAKIDDPLAEEIVTMNFTFDEKVQYLTLLVMTNKLVIED